MLTEYKYEDQKKMWKIRTILYAAASFYVYHYGENQSAFNTHPLSITAIEACRYYTISMSKKWSDKDEIAIETYLEKLRLCGDFRKIIAVRSSVF